MGTLIRKAVKAFKEKQDLRKLQADIRRREQSRQQMYDERTR